MKKNDTTPKPSAIATRIEQLQAELATVEQALAVARDTAAASLLSGADPLELQQATQALRDKQSATAGAIVALQAAYAEALQTGLTAAALSCGMAQQAVIAAHHNAVCDTMKEVGIVLDKLDDATAAANDKLSDIRAAALSALSLAEGSPEAGQFRSPLCGCNPGAEIRRITEAALI